MPTIPRLSYLRLQYIYPTFTSHTFSSSLLLFSIPLPGPRMWEQVLYPELPGILAYVCITKSLGPLCAPLTSQWFSSSHSPVVWPLSHFLHHLACVSSLISSLTVSSSLAKVTLSSLGNGWPSAFDRPLIGYEYPRRKC